MRILVLSNGRGEDVLAVTFLKSLQSLTSRTKTEIDCVPLVGDGHSYSQNNFQVAQHWQALPSQGFLMNPVSFLNDLFSGLIGQTWQQINWLRQNAAHYDLILSFGDMTTVFLLSLCQHPKHYHFDTALTVYLRKFFVPEMWLLRSHCQKVFVRDAATAQFLQSHQVPAIFEGSLMLDDENLQTTELLKNLPNQLVVLLPSSRADAEFNSQYLLQLLAQESWSENFVLALHPAVSPQAIQKIMTQIGLQIPIYQGALGNLIPQSKAVIGMSGTGCEQMAAMGIPVFLVETKQAASNSGRMQHYRKVLGSACEILNGNDYQKTSKLKKLLNDISALQKMKQAGPQRFGNPGASQRIAQIIYRECF